MRGFVYRRASTTIFVYRVCLIAIHKNGCEDCAVHKLTIPMTWKNPWDCNQSAQPLGSHQLYVAVYSRGAHWQYPPVAPYVPSQASRLLAALNANHQKEQES